MKLRGVFLPIITPFINEEIDFFSYKKLIDHYINENINGLIANGTTGESPTINNGEFEKLLDKTIEYTKGRIKIFYGIGGNNTDQVINKIKIINRYKINGILSVCPYYNRPTQNGIYTHFLKISESTDLDIIIYNIPYRTGINVENETVFKLAELKNIIGIKDSCGDIKQSMNLIINASEDFSVLTGDDIFYYLNLCFGGDGGILASAHLQTSKYISIYNYINKNDNQSALKIWKELINIIPLLFEEPNPAPIKYLLKNHGLIKSDEVRLPLLDISNNLQRRLDGLIFINN